MRAVFALVITWGSEVYNLVILEEDQQRGTAGAQKQFARVYKHANHVSDPPQPNLYGSKRSQPRLQPPHPLCTYTSLQRLLVARSALQTSPFTGSLHLADGGVPP